MYPLPNVVAGTTHGVQAGDARTGLVEDVAVAVDLDAARPDRGAEEDEP